MSVLNKKLFEAAVSLHGVSDYAHSGLEDRPMRARVELRDHARADIGDRHPLALLIPLAASRMLSLCRRAPRLVPPIMTVVEACAETLVEGPSTARAFRLREVVET